ncbi:MAG: hypothetical protein AVDCRST_MAG66-3729, partial [uncultured Pseudonocardia sp.]
PWTAACRPSCSATSPRTSVPARRAPPTSIPA